MRCASSSPKIAPDARTLLASTRRHRPISVAVAESDVQSLRAQALHCERTLAGRIGGDLQKAIRVWQELVCGESSVLDSFESSGRLYILAKRHGRGPRWNHLTPRECEVLFYVAAGESHKATGYRLGLSRLLYFFPRELGHAQAGGSYTTAARPLPA